MKIDARVCLALNVDNDALVAHRDGTCLRLSVLRGLVLTPFVLLHLRSGNLLMLGVNATVVAVMLGNAAPAGAIRSG